MSRSVWKGPFVDPSLLKKVEKLKGQTNTAPIKTWARKCTIIPEFVGHSFLIFQLSLVSWDLQTVLSILILT